MITAALAALPLISELGQSVGKTIRQDLAGFLGLGQGGQNVPGSATSSATSAATAVPPTSFPALAQTFRTDLSGLLVSLQGAAGSLAGASPSTIASDLISAINPNGDGTISKPQFEQAIQGVANVVGGHGQHHGWTIEATNLADRLFTAIDTNGDGQVTADELTAFVTQAQQQAAAKYQATQKLAAGFGAQLGALWGSWGGASEPGSTVSTTT